MTTTLRAGLSLALLAVFYVLAVGVVVGLGVLSALCYKAGWVPAGNGLALGAVGAAIGIVAALRRLRSLQDEPVPGLVLTPDRAPELWATIEEIAAIVNTRVPDEIRLVGDVDAAVSEDVRAMGLFSGFRRLYLGAPLVQGLDVRQLRAILAHELGHYSQSHTRLGAIAYRGRMAILTTVDELSGQVVGWVLRPYAYLYVLISASVSRRQELEADALAVQVAGREAAQEALRESAALAAAWGGYLAAYVEPAWEDGMAPTATDFFTGFASMIAARPALLAELRSGDPEEKTSFWDSHPAIPARVAAMASMPDTPVDRDDRPATALVHDFEGATTELAELVVDLDGRTLLSWPDLTARAVQADVERVADSVLRAAARTGVGTAATTASVLDLLAAGHGPLLARELGLDTTEDTDETSGPSVSHGSEGTTTEPHEPAVQDPLQPFVEALLRAAVLDAGVARVEHSWSDAAWLRGANGPLDLDEIASLALASGTAAQARAHLEALGVDLASPGRPVGRPTAHGAELVGGLASLLVGDAPHDLYLLDVGLVLVPSPKKTDGGKARMLAVLEATPPFALAEQHTFVSFEDITGGRVHRVTPVRADVELADGTVLHLKETWSGENLGKDSDALLAGFLEGAFEARGLRQVEVR